MPRDQPSVPIITMRLVARGLAVVVIPIICAAPFIMAGGAVQEFGRDWPTFWAATGLAAVMFPGSAALLRYMSQLWTLFDHEC